MSIKWPANPLNVEAARKKKNLVKHSKIAKKQIRRIKLTGNKGAASNLHQKGENKNRKLPKKLVIEEAFPGNTGSLVRF